MGNGTHLPSLFLQAGDFLEQLVQLLLERSMRSSSAFVALTCELLDDVSLNALWDRP